MFLVRLLVLGLIFIAGPALAQSVPSPEFADGLYLCANYPNALCPAGSSPIGLNQAFQQKLNYPTGTQATGDIPVATSSTATAWTSPSSWFDTAYCNTVGYIIVRFTGAWTCSQAIPANVNWWGADPTGTNDSEPAFAATIAALTKGGAVSYCGTFKFLETLVIPSNITMQGCGRGAATIVGSGSADLPLFQVGNGSNNPVEVQINDTAFSYATNQTSGGAIWVRNGHNVRLNNIWAYNGSGVGYAWIIFDGGAGQFIYSLDHFELSGGSYGIINGKNVLVADVLISNGIIASSTVAGISNQNISGLYASRVDVIGATVGMEVIPGNGQIVNGFGVTSFYLDTSVHNGLVINPSGTGYAWALQFNALWAASSTTAGTTTGNGVYITNGGAGVSGVSFNGCNFVNNQKHGAQIDGGSYITFTNCQVAVNSQAGSADYNGYNIAANVNHVSIIGGAAGGITSPALATNNQGYGINIATGTGADLTVWGVDTTGNVTGGINNGATGLSNNIGANPAGPGNYLSDALSIGTTYFGGVGNDRLIAVGNTMNPGVYPAAGVGMLHLSTGSGGGGPEPPNLANSLLCGIYDTGPVAWCQSITPGTSVNALALNPQGGQVTIGSGGLAVGGTIGIPQATWTDTQTCTAGQISVDASYIYVCTATNTVKRAALSGF